MKIYSTYNRLRLKSKLANSDFTFIENESRMNYGHIGNLWYRGEIAIIIFPNSFYVHNKDISINESTMNIIELIQTELKELEFKNCKPILLYKDDERPIENTKRFSIFVFNH
jgi:hypothetical protein